MPVRAIAVFLIGCLIGCASSTYKLSNTELQRLAAIAPETRGERVRVTQQLDDHDLGEQQPVTSETVIVQFPIVDFYGPDRRNYYRNRGTWGGNPVKTSRGGGGGGGLHLGGGGGGGGGDGAALIIVVAIIVVVAAIAVLSVAAVEGSRFDGYAKIHPMHPVYLVGSDGTKAVLPLAWIDPVTARWARHGFIRRTEGPWIQLERAPLDRRGPYFGMYGGTGSYRALDGSHTAGPATTIQLGVFPVQQLGLVGSLFMGWRETDPHQYLIDMRYTLEAQVFPLSRGSFLQPGVFLGYGGNYIREEVVIDGSAVAAKSATSSIKTGGLMLQLDINTRVSLTGRFGLANNGDGPKGEAIFGLSVY